MNENPEGLTMGKIEGFTTGKIESWEQGLNTVDRLYSVTEPEAVFGKPIQSGERTVITCSEVAVGVGFGFGGGSGGEEPAQDEDEEGDEAPSEEEEENASYGSGFGGGGGGHAFVRPVAVITVGPEGVDVEPIVDVTKLGLALFTAMGTMFLMFRRMRKGRL
jgi:uncharacterized spore protein YtfJ